MAVSSRLGFLDPSLDALEYYDSLQALDLVMKEMCAEKGFKRHNGTHYYYHLVDVTQKLLNFGVRNQDIITASILHDIVEDVPGYSLTMIATLFNPRVAEIVSLVTKDPSIDYKEDKAALQQYLDGISENVGAALIKVADRIHNLQTLREASVEKRQRQAAETKTYFIPFIKVCRERYPRHSKFFFEAKTNLEVIIENIKERHEEVSKLEEKVRQLELELKNTKK